MCLSIGDVPDVTSQYALQSNSVNMPIQSIDAHTGATNWTTHVDSSFTELTALSDHLFVVTRPYNNQVAGDTVLHAFSIADGSTLWTLDTHSAHVAQMALG